MTTIHDRAESEWCGALATAIALALRAFAQGSPQRAERLLERAFDDYLGSPACPQELADVLGDVLRLSAAELERLRATVSGATRATGDTAGQLLGATQELIQERRGPLPAAPATGLGPGVRLVDGEPHYSAGWLDDRRST